jgi:aubergine-like protein
MTTYNCRIYTIDDIVFTMSPKNEFTLQDGKKTSYAKYLLDNYKIKLQYTDDQPLIKSILRKGRPNESVIYLVPETCVLTGITDEQKGKNFRDIKDDMFANAERK